MLFEYGPNTQFKHMFGSKMALCPFTFQLWRLYRYNFRESATPFYRFGDCRESLQKGVGNAVHLSKNRVERHCHNAIKCLMVSFRDLVTNSTCFLNTVSKPCSTKCLRLFASQLCTLYRISSRSQRLRFTVSVVLENHSKKESTTLLIYPKIVLRGVATML